jgi:hypothetical protein
MTGQLSPKHENHEMQGIQESLLNNTAPCRIWREKSFGPECLTEK